MENNTYSFGSSLLESIKSGKITRTKLYYDFVEKMKQKTGIEVLFASFSHAFASAYLSIEVDLKKHTDILKNTGSFYCGAYYPKGGLHDTISECINLAVIMNGLPKIELSRPISISIQDYISTSSNVYFSNYIVQIEKTVKKDFPNQRLIVRWRHADTNIYYLIFEDEEELEKANREQVIEKIIDCVNDYCKANDPLNIFANTRLLPVITTKPELQARGEVMGIMRNNTEFSSW